MKSCGPRAVVRMLVLAALVPLPKVGVTAEAVEEQQGAPEGSAFRREGGVKYAFIRRPGANLDIVQRLDPAGTTALTSITFFPSHGTGFSVTIDGRTGESVLVTARGVVTLKPAGQHNWLLCAKKASEPEAVAAAAVFECHLINDQNGDTWPKGALASAVDLQALRGFTAFALQEGLTPARLGADTEDFWTCVAAVLAALAADVQMAVECGTPGLNVLTCSAAVAAYSAALIAVAQACDAATW